MQNKKGDFRETGCFLWDITEIIPQTLKFLTQKLEYATQTPKIIE